MAQKIPSALGQRRIEDLSGRALLDHAADVEYRDPVTDAARERPDRPAILFKGATITWSALDRLRDACAAALEALGVVAFLDMHEVEREQGAAAAQAALRRVVMTHLDQGRE